MTMAVGEDNEAFEKKIQYFLSARVCERASTVVCGRVPLCADWISLQDRLRCVKAEDECRFNHSVSFGTQSFSLLTSI